MSISQILGILNPEQFKLHAARWNKKHNPLDVFINDRDEWDAWNQWISSKDEFNRTYILAIMDFYSERDNWLFGGIYEVKGFKEGYDNKSRHCHAYDTILTNYGQDYIGRLKIHAPIRSRGRVFNLENRLHDMQVHEILPVPYTGKPFPGYFNVSLSWNELCQIVRNDRIDWKTALSHIQGVYLISLADGRQYVGSAGGAIGVWSRWATYANTKDGGNVLMRHANDRSVGKFIDGARFTLLEVLMRACSENELIERENYWKTVLGSRVYGLNAN